MQRSFTNDDLTKLIDDARRSQFWGEIALQIQRGQVITIKKIQTLKKEGNNQFDVYSTNR